MHWYHEIACLNEKYRHVLILQDLIIPLIASNQDEEEKKEIKDQQMSLYHEKDLVKAQNVLVIMVYWANMFLSEW